MILFKNVTKHEGNKFAQDAYIMFGKCVYGSNNIADGWYIKLNIPIKQYRVHPCPITFNDVAGNCEPTFLLRIRKRLHRKYYTMMLTKWWTPVDDPYLAALNIKDKI